MGTGHRLVEVSTGKKLLHIWKAGAFSTAVAHIITRLTPTNSPGNPEK
jgi:hypothetical protein